MATRSAVIVRRLSPLFFFSFTQQSLTLLRACSCPGGDHPGPVYNKGRGAPEIDIFEAEKDKDNGVGQVVSQSAQFAPFTHDYLYDNSTEANHKIFDTSRTRPNSYHGSAVQQSVSSLTRVPSDMFQGQGKNFKVFGFEYWSDPNNPLDGYVQWVVDGTPSHRLGAGAVGPDPLELGGSGVGQRLIPLEPMSIVLNLGISRESIRPSFTASPFSLCCSKLANDRHRHDDVPFRVPYRLRPGLSTQRPDKCRL